MWRVLIAVALGAPLCLCQPAFAQPPSGRVVAVPKGKLPVGFNTDQDLIVDTTRIRAELGFKEVVDPDDALRQTVSWERNHLPEEPVDYAREDALMAELRHG
jgi:nucleoside-diphosphate-sugar epimerase